MTEESEREVTATWAAEETSRASRRHPAGSSKWLSHGYWGAPAGLLRLRNQFHKRNAIRLSIFAAILVIIQFIGDKLSPIVFPPVSAVAHGAYTMVVDGSLGSALLPSLEDIVVGVLVVTVLGVGSGLVLGMSRRFGQGGMPLVYLASSVPMIALLPLVSVWFGIGFTARIMYILTVSVWPLVINTVQGVRAIDGRFQDVANSFRLGRWTKFRQVVLPGSVPYIFSGVRIALNLIIISMIIGGQEIGQNGLGGAAETYGTVFETNRVVVIVVISGLIAMVCFGGLRLIRERVAPWVSATGS